MEGARWAPAVAGRGCRGASGQHSPQGREREGRSGSPAAAKTAALDCGEKPNHSCPQQGQSRCRVLTGAADFTSRARRRKGWGGDTGGPRGHREAGADTRGENGTKRPAGKAEGRAAAPAGRAGRPEPERGGVLRLRGPGAAAPRGRGEGRGGGSTDRWWR